MEINEQKQNMGSMMTTKKYKLSFFGVSPKHDWNVLFNIGVVLLIVFSLLYYFDNKNIKSSISEDSLVGENKKPFDVEKAKNLIKALETKRGMVDQSQ